MGEYPLPPPPKLPTKVDRHIQERLLPHKTLWNSRLSETPAQKQVHMALSRGVHPDRWHKSLVWPKFMPPHYFIRCKMVTRVNMEHPGGECNASNYRTQQIDQDLQECVTRDAVGVGWLHCWHLPSVGQKENMCVSRSYAEHNVG